MKNKFGGNNGSGKNKMCWVLVGCSSARPLLFGHVWGINVEKTTYTIHKSKLFE
jgi:hypothetical protein